MDAPLLAMLLSCRLGAKAAIDGVHRAGNATGMRTRELENEASHVLGGAVTFDRHDAVHLVGERAVSRVHVRVGRAWLDDVDGDAARPEIAGETARHALKRVAASPRKPGTPFRGQISIRRLRGAAHGRSSRPAETRLTSLRASSQQWRGQGRAGVAAYPNPAPPLCSGRGSRAPRRRRS